MLSRRHFALGAAAALSAGPALAYSNSPSRGPLLDVEKGAADRLTVPVMIGDAGPYRFVVDTGADVSVLASEIAADLALPAGKGVLIHGITGSEMVGTVRTPALDLGLVRLKPSQLPAMPRDRLGADGLLGMDALKNHRLLFDFRAPRLEVRAASGRSTSRLDSRFVVIPAQENFGRLTVVNTRVGDVGATAFVDSGSGFTVASPALAEQMRRDGRWRSPAPRVDIAGVTDHVVVGEGRVIDRLRFGSMGFRNIPVVVADLHLFDRWGLTDQPALLLGIDVLGLFAKVELDYGRRRLLFRAAAAEGWRA